MKDEKAIALEYIRRYVRSGVLLPGEIVGFIDGVQFDRGEIDRDWLRAEIKEEFRRWQPGGTSCPVLTDSCPLDLVFECLDEQGIIAMKDAGIDLSHGLSVVEQYYDAAGGEASGHEGYCYYHGQDLESIIETGQLHLAYGAFGTDDDEPHIAIGHRVKQALEEGGFEVEWDGSIERRILVKGLRGRRRPCTCSVDSPWDPCHDCGMADGG
jgi:hypothetical protein